MWGREAVGRSEAVGKRAVPGAGEEDPRVLALQAGVARLRRELDGYPAVLSDRRTAEDGLDALAAMAGAGVPDVRELRYALLQVVGAVGSVSAFAEAMTDVRNAVELFGEPAQRAPAPRAPTASEAAAAEAGPAAAGACAGSGEEAG